LEEGLNLREAARAAALAEIAAATAKKPHKYGAKAKTTDDGIRHASTAEAERWNVLRALQRAGAIRDLARQVAFPLLVNGAQIGKYVADFVYYWPNNQRVIEDVKGVETAMFRRSAKHMAAHGDPVTVWKKSKSPVAKRRTKR
jgi:hypothetical protein